MEDTKEDVCAVICDPPYSTPCITERSNSENDHSNLQNMSLFVELLPALMDLGPHGEMFWSTLQFKTWYELLVGEAEEVARCAGVQESKKPGT